MPSLADARMAIRTARSNMREGDARAAGNRAYYAIFYAAQAVLSSKAEVDVSGVKTHHGLRRLFELYLVKPGLFPKELARFFTDVQQTRWEADYTDNIPAQPDIQEAIDEAEEFVEACEKLIRAAP